MQVQSQKTEIFQVGKRNKQNQKMIDNWGNAKMVLLRQRQVSYRLHVGHAPVSRPVKLLVALKFVDDYSFIQIWNATIGLGIMPRIWKKVLAQPFNFYVEQLAKKFVGNMNISGKEKDESYRIQRQCS